MSLSPLDRAIAHHQAGAVRQAAAAYRQILDQTPGDPDALHLMGMLVCGAGRPAEALAWIDAAIAASPRRAAFHNTRARALAGCGRGEAAEAAYRTAWELRPDLAEIANNLACLLRDRGDVRGAVDWFWRATAKAPGNAAIVVNLAQALAETGAHAAALMQFQHALLLRPDCAEAYYGMGRMHMLLGQPVLAEQTFRGSLRIAPDHAPSHNNLGVALERQGKPGMAAQSFRDALRCDPNHADAHSNLGCLLLIDNLQPEARACQERALACAPRHGKALWARCMVELPVLYHAPAEIPQQRERYAQALDVLERAAADPLTHAALAAAAGSFQPFFLPYQGQCDRDLQARYGALLTRLIPPDPAIELASPPAPGEIIRVGIVTGFACEHTIWRLMVKGWLTHLDRAEFAVTLYHTGAVLDEQTKEARNLADQFSSGTAEQIRSAILRHRPHALIYPELGIDPVCARLAVERLAPLQCVGWGHPQTSGLPSIDWFLSGAAMEPPGAALHYTENLVCLPNLGVHPMLQTEPADPAGRAAFGLRPGATVFWCGQALYKYLPQFDQVFARIAQSVPDSQFLFIGFAKSAIVTAQFGQRVARAFAALGLDAARHVVLLASMEQPRFHASLRAADIVLDSIGWSGGKSTLDSLLDDPVIVTLEGGLMRARHTAGILRCLGLTETIASDVDGYVQIAVDLARDPPRRQALRSRLRDARGWLMDDLAPIRALESLLRNGAVTGPAAATLGPEASPAPWGHHSAADSPHPA